MIFNSDILNSSLVAGILGVLAAHLLTSRRERSSELRRMRTRAARLTSLLLNDVRGLRANLRDKYFFITTTWEEVRHAASGPYEASPLDLSSLERIADQLTDASELSDEVAELLYSLIRRVKVMLNEYTEAPNHFAAPAVRGMLGLRLHNVCVVEQTLAALEDCLRAEQLRLQVLAHHPWWRGRTKADRVARSAAPSECALCGSTADRQAFLVDPALQGEDHRLVDRDGSLRPPERIPCKAPLLREFAALSVSVSALKGLKQVPLAAKAVADDAPR
jgi:hypothetical protein